MADDSKDEKAGPVAETSGADGSLEMDASGGPLAVSDEPEMAAAEIGVDRYVHAAFFAVAIIAAYLISQILTGAWGYLAETPAAIRTAPFLLEYTEDQRGTICLIVGAVVGVGLVLRYYRRPAVRGWAFDVARELGRVTWPNQDTVTSGTFVVIVASVIATIYVTLLDRFWGYLTNLVYGA
jgi:preprotein translocase subunit SecE